MSSTPSLPPPSPDRIIIVGTPNVGKSALFNALTGQRVTVSNYPGTTVEIAHGHSRIEGHRFEVIDTPGMYALMPITDEERVAGQVVCETPARAVLHVVDAKSLKRMLGLTLQLIEARLPVILVVNMIDEARDLGFQIDIEALERKLGIPVVATVAVTHEGVHRLIERIADVRPAQAPTLDYGRDIDDAVNYLAGCLDEDAALTVSRRTRALLLLQGDPAMRARLLGGVDDRRAAAVLDYVSRLTARLEHSPHYYVAVELRAMVETILADIVKEPETRAHRFQDRLDHWMMQPLTGIPILLLILYFGLYRFVGVFAAGSVVDFLEEHLFEARLNPWFIGWSQRWIPWEPLRDLVAGEYGVLTLGVRYAVALVFPIVGAFFLFFSILEDSGYLPRLAMGLDRIFKKIGLNGRAVIPMVLGFGCGTMATLVTRTLETTRERVICTLLLSLAIPCSAQLGVIIGLLSGHPAALLVWSGFILSVFLLAGFLAARLLPGSEPLFYMELPPLRRPRLAPILLKTYARMVWYFREVLPLFLLASVLIWIGQITHIFPLLLRSLSVLTAHMGLPDETAVAFLFGFFRRDYGAAGLFDLDNAGLLSVNQITVAAITLTLFLPCIAQLLVMLRERGWRMTLSVMFGVTLFAFGAGWFVHQALTLLKITL